MHNRMYEYTCRWWLLEFGFFHTQEEVNNLDPDDLDRLMIHFKVL